MRIRWMYLYISLNKAFNDNANAFLFTFFVDFQLSELDLCNLYAKAYPSGLPSAGNNSPSRNLHSVL